jgi:hypothetical protein
VDTSVRPRIHLCIFFPLAAEKQAAAYNLGPVNTCFALTTMTDFSRNKAGAAQQSKLCKRQVTTGRVEFRPVPKGCARKNAGAALQSLAIGPLCPALRALPSRFFAQQRGRETSVNRP